MPTYPIPQWRTAWQLPQRSRGAHASRMGNAPRAAPHGARHHQCTLSTKARQPYGTDLQCVCARVHVLEHVCLCVGGGAEPCYGVGVAGHLASGQEAARLPGPKGAAGMPGGRAGAGQAPQAPPACSPTPAWLGRRQAAAAAASRERAARASRLWRRRGQADTYPVQHAALHVHDLRLHPLLGQLLGRREAQLGHRARHHDGQVARDLAPAPVQEV